MLSLAPLKRKGAVMPPFSHMLAAAPVTKLLKGTTGATRYMWHLIKPGSFWKATVSSSGGLSASQVHFSKKALHTPSQPLVVNDGSSWLPHLRGSRPTYLWQKLVPASLQEHTLHTMLCNRFRLLTSCCKDVSALGLPACQKAQCSVNMQSVVF